MKSEKKVDGKIFSHTVVVALFEVAVEQTFFCSRMNKWSSFSFHHHHRTTSSRVFFVIFKTFHIFAAGSKNADAVKPVGLHRISGFGPKAGQDWA